MEEKRTKKEKKKVLNRRGILWSYALFFISLPLTYIGISTEGFLIEAFGVLMCLTGAILNLILMRCPHCGELLLRESINFNPFDDHGGYCHKCGGELLIDRKFRE